MAMDMKTGIDFGIAIAKAEMRMKVAFWNLVRAVVAFPFLILGILMIKMGFDYGFDWPTNTWIIICAFVVIRNIRKSNKESRNINKIINE